MLTNNSIVASYLEDEVQITGLSITQIQDVEVGLFGIGANVPQVSTDPNVPDEDKVVMQLMSAGLAGTYLYTTTAITELATNFTNPAPDQPLTTTWGITPSIMHVLIGTYPHRDVALATTNQTTTVQMLNDHYVDCSTTPTHEYTPTLALAYQEISGNKDLLNMTKQDTGADSCSVGGPLHHGHGDDASDAVDHLCLRLGQRRAERVDRVCRWHRRPTSHTSPRSAS